MKPNQSIITFIKRNKILREAGYESYQEYLKSDNWKSVKQNFLKKNQKICIVCGAHNKIQIHHNKYTENNLLKGKGEALVSLCDECHKEVHKLARSLNWSLRKAVKSLVRRFGRYGDIHYYPPGTSVSVRYKGL